MRSALFSGYIPSKQSFAMVKDFISKEGDKPSAHNYLNCFIRKYRKKIDTDKTLKILCFMFDTINETEGAKR